MDNNKRLMLEGLFVTGNKYLYPKEVREMMKHYMYVINHDIFKRHEFGKKHHNFFYRAQSVSDHYLYQLSSTATRLCDKKKEAAEIFKDYMAFKKEVVECGSYSDPVIRDILNKKKDAWREVSMDIMKTKDARYACEIEYNALMEYINATREYIKFLEQNQKEKV
jgi:hypothetical protein